MANIIFSCKTKATKREGDRLRFSMNWVFAKRGELRLTDTAVELDNWCIPYKEIDDAVLLFVQTAMGCAYNLVIKSRGEVYHFQLKSKSVWKRQLDPFWMGNIPFPLRKEFTRLGREEG